MDAKPINLLANILCSYGTTDIVAMSIGEEKISYEDLRRLILIVKEKPEKAVYLIESLAECTGVAFLNRLKNVIKGV